MIFGACIASRLLLTTATGQLAKRSPVCPRPPPDHIRAGFVQTEAINQILVGLVDYRRVSRQALPSTWLPAASPRPYAAYAGQRRSGNFITWPIRNLEELRRGSVPNVRRHVHRAVTAFLAVARLLKPPQAVGAVAGSAALSCGANEVDYASRRRID